jgi:metallo-beta-lactamase class B
MKRLVLLIVLGILSHSMISSQELIKINSDVALIKITENAYLHISRAIIPDYGLVSANGLVFVNGDKAFLFDTPWNDSLTRDLTRYLSDSMGLDIEGFVPNHWHDDCMGGLGYLKSRNIRSWANIKTIEIAKKNRLPVPDVGFSDSLKLYLGDKEILCYYPGAAHSTDNIVVWIPSVKILFPGCLCKSLDAVNLGNIADGSISEYPHTISKVIRKFKDAEIIIPGHGSPGGPELLTHTKSLTLN